MVRAQIVRDTLEAMNMENHKRIRRLKLQPFLDGDDSQTRKQLAEQLVVSEQAVFNGY